MEKMKYYVKDEYFILSVKYYGKDEYLMLSMKYFMLSVKYWSNVARKSPRIFQLVGPCEILSHGQKSLKHFKTMSARKV